MTDIKHVAWTGGSFPLSPADTPRDEWQYSNQLFHEQVEMFQAFWGDDPDLNTRNVFWLRARADAHATFRKV